MAGGFDKLAETVFKEVPGGYVWHAPHPWLFGPRQFYFVTDAQKAAILECFRGEQRILIPMLIVGIVLVVALVAAFTYFKLNSILIFTLGIVVALVPTVAVPHVYLIRRLAPIMIGLPKSDQRITQREFHQKLAEFMPTWVLVIGLLGSVVMLLGSDVAGRCC